MNKSSRNGPFLALCACGAVIAACTYGYVRAEESARTQEAITEAEVRQFCKGIEVFCNQKDFDAYGRTLSDEVKVIGTIDNKQVIISRQDFIRNLQEAWATVTDYQYSFQIQDIQIQAAQAVVLGKEQERCILPDGEAFSTESTTTLILEKEEGLIKQKSIEAVVRSISS